MALRFAVTSSEKEPVAPPMWSPPCEMQIDSAGIVSK